MLSSPRQELSLTEILENIVPMAYHLALLPFLQHMHDVFHVSVFRKYVHDPSHILDWHHFQVMDKGVLKEELICILDHHTQYLRRHTVDRVKVKWDLYSPSSATWEDTSTMRTKFPFLFI
jgi:hypothetical protein